MARNSVPDFARVLAGAAADPTGLAELALCAELEQHRLLELTPDAARLLEQNDWLEAFERNPDQRSADFAEENYLLQQLPPPLLSAHAQPLARTLLALDDPVRVQYLLYGLPITVVTAYLYTVSNDSRSFGPKLVAGICAATVRAERQLPRSDPSRQISDYVDVRVADWCRGASKREIRKVSHYIRSFDDGLANSWDAFAAAFRRPLLLRLVTGSKR